VNSKTFHKKSRGKVQVGEGSVNTRRIFIVGKIIVVFHIVPAIIYVIFIPNFSIYKVFPCVVPISSIYCVCDNSLVSFLQEFSRVKLLNWFCLRSGNPRTKNKVF